jgi:hypothetical protein
MLVGYPAIVGEINRRVNGCRCIRCGADVLLEAGDRDLLIRIPQGAADPISDALDPKLAGALCKEHPFHPMLHVLLHRPFECAEHRSHDGTTRAGV